MKILFVSTLYEPNIVGGAERVVQTVAEGLAAVGHQCVVVTISKNKMRETRVINGVKVHYLPIRNLYVPFGVPGPGGVRKVIWHVLDTINPLMGAALEAVLVEERPDVVNTHSIAGFSVTAWKVVKGRQLPLVHTLHDHYLLCPRTTMFHNGANCIKQCAVCSLYSAPRRWASHLPDVAMGVSQYILDRHVACGCFGEGRQTVVNNAYERVCQLPNPTDRDIKARPLRFGFLGLLHQIKGIESLITAFLTLPAGTAELWIGGRGKHTYEAHLKGLTAGRCDINWMGFVEAETLLAQVDVLVIPSMCHDTAPRVVQEALAWGLPIIASRRGGLPEMVPATVGWVFEPDVPGSLQAILGNCLRRRDELSDMRAVALLHAKKFSTEAMLAGYIKNYKLAGVS